MPSQNFRAGDIIFREGEESDVAYIVESGEVEIFKRMQGGTLLLASLGPGEVFGEMGLINDQPRSASAAAHTDCSVSVLTRDLFAGLMEGQPPEKVIIIKALIERLREMNLKLSQLATKYAQFQLNRPDEAPPVRRMTLFPLSAALKNHMQKSGVVLPSLPFRVGASGGAGIPLDWNDLALPDPESHFLARNHFVIQRGERGLAVMDRGSRLGTIVNGVKIGGGSEEFKMDLNYGENEIIAGGEDSPFRFALLWE